MKSLQSRADKTDGVARSQRYEIEAAIQFRARGEKTWHHGYIRNISISGVLIQTDRLYPLGTALKMRFVLPANVNGKTGAEVFCRALVVRSSPPQNPSGLGYFAATIDQSRLVRPGS